MTVRGFRLRAEGASAYLIGVIGQSGGGCLEYLEMSGTRAERFVGVTLEGVVSAEASRPFGSPMTSRTHFRRAA